MNQQEKNRKLQFKERQISHAEILIQGKDTEFWAVLVEEFNWKRSMLIQEYLDVGTSVENIIDPQKEYALFKTIQQKILQIDSILGFPKSATGKIESFKKDKEKLLREKVD